MAEAKKPVKGLADEIVGRAKRAIGELTARPDIVLDGEAQEAKGRREEARSRSAGENPEG